MGRQGGVEGKETDQNLLYNLFSVKKGKKPLRFPFVSPFIIQNSPPSKMPSTLNFKGVYGIENHQQINVWVSGAVSLLDRPSCSGKQVCFLCGARWQRHLPLLPYLPLRALPLAVGPRTAPSVLKTVLHLSWTWCHVMILLALFAAAPPEKFPDPYGLSLSVQET